MGGDNGPRDYVELFSSYFPMTRGLYMVRDTNRGPNVSTHPTSQGLGIP